MAIVLCTYKANYGVSDLCWLCQWSNLPIGINILRFQIQKSFFSFILHIFTSVQVFHYNFIVANLAAILERRSKLKCLHAKMVLGGLLWFYVTTSKCS